MAKKIENDNEKKTKKVNNTTKSEIKAKVVENDNKKKEIKNSVKDLETVRVENKKVNYNKKVKYKTAEQEEMIKFFGVIVVVLICVALVYLVTRVFVTKDLFKDDAKKEQPVAASVNYSVTSVGQILNRPYDSYYVLVFDANGDYSVDMNNLLIDYNNKEQNDNKLHAYTVDLGNHLNKDFYDSKAPNPKAQSVQEFKFGDVTLLKVKNGKVEKYITDLEKMKTELGIDK